MGRGKVVLKRIENKQNRQVSFSKRKGGLIKKANELSVLCDAEVAVIVFSNTGRLFEFGTTDMNSILERYHRQCYISGRANTSRDEYAMQIEEVTKLRIRYESLHRSYSNLLGEGLESFDLQDLEKLENKLDRILSQNRERQDEIMYKKLADLRQTEQDIRDQNAQLKSQIEVGQQSMQQRDDNLGDATVMRYFDFKI